MYNKLLIIILFILIVIYLYNNSNQDSYKENFYTLFKPYNYPKISNNYKKIFQSYNSTNANSCLENKYIDTEVIIGSYLQTDYISTEIHSLTNFISKLILAYTNIITIRTLKYELASELLLDLHKNKIDMAIIPSPIVYEGIIGSNLIYDNNTFTNIQFITNTNNTYIYILVNISNSYSNIYDIKGRKMYAGKKNSLSWKCANDIYDTINFSKSKDYKFEYTTLNNALKLLNLNKIGSILITDTYPSKIIYNIIKNDNTIYLLPLDEINEQIFINRFFYYEKAYIDLNNISNSYLPKKVGNKLYNIYNPNLITYNFCNMLVNNNKFNQDITYNIVKSIHNNIDIINTQLIYNFNKLSNIYMTFTYIPLPMSKGVLQFLEESGYITYNNSKNYVHYLGKKKCNKYNLSLLNNRIIH